MHPLNTTKYKISQGFGDTDFANSELGKTIYALGVHSGIDFATPIGTPVYAVESGTVYLEYNKDGFGTAIRLFSGDKSKYAIERVYGHLSSSVRENGEQVKTGDIIGYTGNTGTSTAPHLHYGKRLWENGVVKNYSVLYKTSTPYGYIDPSDDFTMDKFFDSLSEAKRVEFLISLAFTMCGDKYSDVKESLHEANNKLRAYV